MHVFRCREDNSAFFEFTKRRWQIPCRSAKPLHLCTWCTNVKRGPLKLFFSVSAPHGFHKVTVQKQQIFHATVCTMLQRTHCCILDSGTYYCSATSELTAITYFLNFWDTGLWHVDTGLLHSGIMITLSMYIYMNWYTWAPGYVLPSILY